MKKVLKIFFIIVCFFVTLAVCKDGVNVESFQFNNSVVAESIGVPHQVLVSPDDNESQIATSNIHSSELISANFKKNSHNISNIDKALTESRLATHIFVANYRKILYSLSHRISLYLFNEVCTRAP